MKCTELIVQDHALLRRCLDIVDGMLKRLEEGARIEIADVSTILKFLRLFGDQYHQSMEEQILFPAMLEVAPGETELRQFVTDHGSERTLVVQIEEMLMSRRGMAFFCSTRQLTSLLRHHCDMEEIILRQLAEQYLSKEQDDAIFAAFMTARREVENYGNFPGLERKYLPKPPKEHIGPTHEIARARGASYL